MDAVLVMLKNVLLLCFIGIVSCCPRPTTPPTRTEIPTTEDPSLVTTKMNRNYAYKGHCLSYFMECRRTVIDFQVLMNFTNIIIDLPERKAAVQIQMNLTSQIIDLPERKTTLYLSRSHSYEFENTFLTIYNQVHVTSHGDGNDKNIIFRPFWVNQKTQMISWTRTT